MGWTAGCFCLELPRSIQKRLNLCPLPKSWWESKGGTTPMPTPPQEIRPYNLQIMNQQPLSGFPWFPLFGFPWFLPPKKRPSLFGFHPRDGTVRAPPSPHAWSSSFWMSCTRFSEKYGLGLEKAACLGWRDNTVLVQHLHYRVLVLKGGA